MKQVSSKTALKCSFSNEVHKILEPNLDVKRSQRWQHKKTLTDKQKLEAFDKIVELHNEYSNLITSALQKKAQKKQIQKERIARGWKPKKKTSKEEYLKAVTV